jgi:hypothetical protein
MPEGLLRSTAARIRRSFLPVRGWTIAGTYAMQPSPVAESSRLLFPSLGWFSFP